MRRRSPCVGLLAMATAWLLPALGTISLVADEPAVPRPMPVFTHGARILFQGDSITDGNRGRSADPNHVMGHGYAFIIAAKYGCTLAERDLTFLNRGVSSNTVAHLQARWQKDTLDLKPDVLSILIGINDRHGSPELFETTYDKLLADTVAALPDVRLVICEPFQIPCSEKVRELQAIAARLAAKHRAPLVRFQRVFDEANARVGGKYWIWDTVHPTYSGHQLMADEWVRTVEEFYRSDR
jgi:lysophospholipase L1-like esterase